MGEQVHLAREPARRLVDGLEPGRLEERELGAGEPEQMGEVLAQFLAAEAAR